MPTLPSTTNRKEREAAETIIHQAPLSVEIRTDWHTLAADNTQPTHYRLLLATGGPAVQIEGELDDLIPCNASIAHQDWGTPWTALRGTTSEDDALLLSYALMFYYGE